MGVWEKGIEAALQSLEGAAERNLAVRKAQMPEVNNRGMRRQKRLGTWKDKKWLKYGLSAKQKELIGYLVSCGPEGAPKKAIYEAIYAPEDIQPYRIDHDVMEANVQLQGVGYWIRCGRGRDSRRWIEPLVAPTDDGLPVLLEDLCGVESEQKRRMLRHLLDMGKFGATLVELVDVVYGDKEDGGPLDPMSVLKVYIYQMKRAMEPEFTIERIGIGFGRYRLQRT